MTARIRVGIVDEHEMFALGLRACLEEHSMVDVLTRPEDDMDVAVVSPQAAGARRFGCPLVVCGDPPSRLAQGNLVLAVLPRATLTAEQIFAGVHAAVVGLQVSPPGMACAPRLDRRGLGVLELLATGATTREIAGRLGYSDRTIKSVIAQIQLALGARSRAQAVAEGIRQGLI